jgi:hypothetical protein
LDDRASPGRIRITTKADEEGETSYRNEESGEEKRSGGFLTGVFCSRSSW